MKVGDNTLGFLELFFKKELQAIWGDSECRSMFKMACEEYLAIPFNRNTPLELRLSESEILLFLTLIKGLKNQLPIQYILGCTFFYDLKLHINSSVLIPRPETEELVHWIITDNPHGTLSIVDLCTGSGCIALALKSKLPHSPVIGYDISEEAIKVARENATDTNLNVSFQVGDILNKEFSLPPVDLIVSNPPYIPREEMSELASHVLNHEPHIALFVEDSDPLLFYKVLANIASRHLLTGGQIYLECHYLYAQMVKGIFEDLNFSQVEIRTDINGKQRMVRAEK